MLGIARSDAIVAALELGDDVAVDGVLALQVIFCAQSFFLRHAERSQIRLPIA